MPENRKRVGIFIFDNVEVLDFAGPFEVFSVVRLDENNRRNDVSPFDVFLFAQTPGVINTTGNMHVLPQYNFNDCPALDILLVPGGWGTRKELNNENLLNWLKVRSKEVEIISSVCTGSMVLGFAGLLDNLQATTHWRSLDWMKESFPNVTVLTDKHWVVDGNVYTSAGISAGIDMALQITAHYFGESIAKATAKHMEYPYPVSNERRIDL